MKFADEARIHVKAGDGGNGCVSFLREPFKPKGGPNGGDGGKGGDVVLVADAQLATLLDLTYPHSHRGQRGAHGKGKDQTGRSGEDLLIRVPAGTLVWDDETGELLADLVEAGQRLVIARGGRGGRGNAHFATPTRRVPRFAQKGEAGEEKRLRFELKLLADAGLIGFPNVGKSTLLSRISSATPKIADYPFTTLSPNLGVVLQGYRRPFVVADIPGLIEGAAQGAGLGLTFLRHVERTRVLVHVITLAEEPGREPVRDFETINRELGNYHPALSEKEQLVVLNKIDLPAVREKIPEVEAQFKALGYALFPVSGMTGEGIEALTDEVAKRVEAKRENGDDR
jgi:GTPase